MVEIMVLKVGIKSVKNNIRKLVEHWCISYQLASKMGNIQNLDKKDSQNDVHKVKES